MNYKVQDFLQRNKTVIVAFIILWVISLVVVVPALATWVVDGPVDFFNSILKVPTTFFQMFSPVEGYVNAEGDWIRFKEGISIKEYYLDSVGNWIKREEGIQVEEVSVTLDNKMIYLGPYFDVTWKWTIAFSVIGFLIILRAKPKSEYNNIEHGSSDWSKNGEQYNILSPKEGIILTKSNYLPIDKRGNTNVLVVGGSGSGKSASYVIPNALQLLGSYVFTDPKGELYDRTAGFLRKNGYDVKVLNLVRPQLSDGYNPIAHIHSELDVDIIANIVIKGQSDSDGGKDPYWEDMAEMLLKALIYYLMEKRPPEEQSLSSCAELVRAANNNGGDNLLTELMSELRYDHPARMNYKSIEIAPEKTYASILSSLQSKLGKFDSKDIAALTSTNTIDFKQLAEKKTAIYVISSDSNAAYNFLLTIFFAQMIQQLYDFADLNGGKLKMPVFFILDEFANIGRIPDFDKKISTSRSRNISFSVILQTLDQMEGLYKDTYDTILSNCDTHLFLGSNSQKTAEYFSKALGEKTISRDSISRSKDERNYSTGKNISDQVMARALLTPDELKRFDPDMAIIFEKGVKPIKDGKYWYYSMHPRRDLAKRAEENHNDMQNIDRGVWRKYNPYNPYKEDTGERTEELKIESLDDLFSDEINDEKPKINYTKTVESKDNTQKPIEPKTTFNDDAFSYDIQKQLEAKFDELFGSTDSTTA